MYTFWHKLPRPFTALAPMEDVTDTVYRQLVAECGRPDVFFTEFTSADGLFSRGRDKVIHRLQFTEAERPLVAQIWGNNPENYFHAAALLSELGFDGIDINMGCPVSKIIKKGCCSGLIENPSLACELIRAAKEGAPTLPISVKTRLGFREIQTESWTQTLLEMQPAALTMHGRTAVQLSKGAANWVEIARVVSIRDAMNSKTVILGNGDVNSMQRVTELHAESAVDGVMIGRGIFQNLFLFNPVATPLAERSPFEKLELLERHLQMFVTTWGKDKRFGAVKKFFKNYISGFSGATPLRTSMIEAREVDEVMRYLKDAKQHWRATAAK